MNFYIGKNHGKRFLAKNHLNFNKGKNFIFILKLFKLRFDNFEIRLIKKNVIFSCSHYSCAIFVLSSYYLYTHVMLILINVQHLQNVAFIFEKGLNGQNDSLPDCQNLIKKVPWTKFPFHLHWGNANYLFTLFGKPWIK